MRCLPPDKSIEQAHESRPGHSLDVGAHMRTIRIFALLLLAVSPCFAEPGEELVALVDLKFLRETEETAAVLCWGEEESDCDVWATHYLWRATVRRVYSGTEVERHFLVLYGRHALQKKNISEMTVVLKKLEKDAPFGARYQVVETGVPQKLVCFRRPLRREEAQTLSRPGSDPLSCLATDDD
jgi:hypothetical protein